MLYLLFALVMSTTAQAALSSDGAAGERNMLSSMGEALSSDPYARENAKGKRIKVAGIYGADTRLSVEDADYPFTAIGRLRQVGTNDYCTATLISPCHVLTAKHCIIEKKGKALNNGKISFTTRDRKETYAWKEVTYGSTTNTSSDWAVITLRGNPGHRVGFMGLAYVDSLDLVGRSGFEVTGYNHDLDRGKNLVSDGDMDFIPSSGDTVGKAKRDQDVAEFRGDSFLGGSGGPIWEINANGDAQIVAVVSATRMDRDSETNKRINKHFSRDHDQGGLAVTTSAFLKGARDFMKSSKCD